MMQKKQSKKQVTIKVGKHFSYLLAQKRFLMDETQRECGSQITLNIGEYRNLPHAQASKEWKRDDTSQSNEFLDITGKSPVGNGYANSRQPSLLSSPMTMFFGISKESDESPCSVTTPANRSLKQRLRVPFLRKINWASLNGKCRDWVKNPMNMALSVWIFCVAIAGAILFMVMTGMLSHVLKRKPQRDIWFEVNNQILNALFTLMCLYLHPRRFHHLALLCRWKLQDALFLRKIYCKGGSSKPNERPHIMVVISLLHLNCFAQYAVCYLNVGFRRSQRPAIGVGLCVSVAITAPIVATIYNILSPLGREYDVESDSEAKNQRQIVGERKPAKSILLSPERKYSFMTTDGGPTEARPEWIGSLFDFWDDVYLAYMSIFCSFCVFGWNMDRLGFGNMYVHITTFILLCMAPFWIFNLAAINIDNEAIRETLGLVGIVLCVFGLLYGGFWRIQMRRRFDLPASTFCCGSPSTTDCVQWLCCSCCSLAQEVRTADFYDIVVDKIDPEHVKSSTPTTLSPLGHEDGLALFRSGPSSPPWSDANLSVCNNFICASTIQLPKVPRENYVGTIDTTMTPPLPLSTERESEQAE